MRGAENPRVFGSVTRGTDTPESDVDILVTVAPERVWELVNLAEDLSDLLGVHVDVVSEGGLKAKHAQLLRDARPIRRQTAPARTRRLRRSIAHCLTWLSTVRL